MDTKNNKGCKAIFAEKLKELRTENGLSQEKLARELGISKGSLGFYETCKNTPDIEVLNNVAKYFNVSYDYLLGVSKNKTTNVGLKSVCQYTGLSENVIEYIKSEDEKEILNLLFDTNEMKIIVNCIKLCTLCHCMKIHSARFYKNYGISDDDTNNPKKIIIDAETNKREYRYQIDYYMREMINTILEGYVRKRLELSKETYNELLDLAESIVKENDKALGRLALSLDDLGVDW